jgi:hypothetical protein
VRSSRDVDALVASLAPLQDEELEPFARRSSAEVLFAEITSERAQRRRLVAGRLVRLAAAATAAIVAAAAIIVALDPASPAAGGIAFERRTGYLIARVVDLRADPDEMRAAFRERGLDIDLELVPVSPSLVGEIVASSESAPGIDYLPDRARGCPQELRCGPIGLRIPLGWEGEAQIVLGREPQASETYVSAGDAFAPGEALQCATGVLGATVRAAASVLDRRGVDAIWHVDEEIDGRVVDRMADSSEGIEDWIVIRVVPASAATVRVFAARSAPTEDAFAAFAKKVNAGC